MRELKPLSRDTVDAALAKAERYRFLNEPSEAESICLDILAVDAHNQSALITLLLALTDQFGAASDAHQRAREVLAALESEYDKAYAIAQKHGTTVPRRPSRLCRPEAGGAPQGNESEDGNA